MNISLDKHHPIIKDICTTIHHHTSSPISTYHLSLVAYFLAQIPAAMRAEVQTPKGDYVPINVYSIAVANSGYGKGHSVNLIEQDLLRAFREKYENETIHYITECHISNEATKNSVAKGTSQEEEEERLTKELASLGPYTFTFDSGTSPALKQLRQRLLITKTGSLNLQMDEVGSHLESNNDILNLYFELYDRGFTNIKLIKETAQQKRFSKIHGSTPANMLLFGTPSKLFDGGSTEKRFFELLESGYARRTIFGYADQIVSPKIIPTSGEEYYERIHGHANSYSLEEWSQYLEKLANPAYHDKKIALEKEEAIYLLDYRAKCEQKASELNEFKTTQKAELEHRYFKVLKLAGVLAFIDKEDKIFPIHLIQAIQLVEDCSVAFEHIVNQDPPYVRLAKYLSICEEDQTQSDLSENLSFYSGGQSRRNELMDLGIAWGYKNNIMINRYLQDGIEFFGAKGIKTTSLDELQVSYSQHEAYNYLSERITWDQLQTLVQTSGYHWCNHSFLNGHRKESNVTGSFNMIVLDIDGGVSVHTVKEMMSQYTWLLNFTKRHTEEEPRFRLILPLNHEHEMTPEEYREFYQEIFQWLPFQVDQSCNQQSKKWLCSNKGVVVNNGKLLDSLQFITRTKKGMEFNKEQRKIASLPALERWIINESRTGQRNNILFKYAMTLKDNGMDYTEVMDKVSHINQQLEQPLNKEELNKTIAVSLMNHY